jgi:hypothetical protein
MSASATPSSPLTPGPDPLHAAFLALLPQVEAHARVAFRHVKCPHRREDAVAEVAALCWLWFVRLARRGKNAGLFVSTLADFAARRVRSGRKLCGQEASKDVLSPLAQTRHGFVVGKLPDWETLSTNPLIDALADNTKTPPDEAACFRIDFPCWRGSLSDRDQRVADDLMLGERTLDVARRHGLSPGRVSQLRRAFLEGWRHFCGESPGAAGPGTTLA